MIPISLKYERCCFIDGKMTISIYFFQVRVPQSDVEETEFQILVKSINKTFGINEYVKRKPEEGVAMYSLCAEDYRSNDITSNGFSVKEINWLHFIRNVFYQFVILPCIKEIF